jgi:hypothetical protein
MDAPSFGADRQGIGGRARFLGPVGARWAASGVSFYYIKCLLQEKFIDFCHQFPDVYNESRRRGEKGKAQP